MKQLNLVLKEIKCDSAGRGLISVAGLAKLAGVQYIQAQRYIESLASYKDENLPIKTKTYDLQKSKFILDIK